jgi:hypothetical protein
LFLLCFCQIRFFAHSLQSDDEPPQSILWSQLAGHPDDEPPQSIPEDEGNFSSIELPDFIQSVSHEQFFITSTLAALKWLPPLSNPVSNLYTLFRQIQIRYVDNPKPSSKPKPIHRTQSQQTTQTIKII